MDRIGGGGGVDEHDSAISIMKEGEKANSSQPSGSPKTVKIGEKSIQWNSSTITAEQLKQLASANGVAEADLEAALKLSGVKKA